MPIKALVDNHKMGAGLPRIARLYKGDKKPESGDRPGRDLSYFRIEFEPQYSDLQDLWNSMYGDKPTEFRSIFLAGNTVDDVYDFWYEEWTATTLLHRCDGEEQAKWWNKDAAMYQTARIACARSDGNDKACACKMIGRLDFILPEFCDAAGVFGKISSSTHSSSDVLTTYKYLRDMERMYGGLSGVPFVFGRAPRQLSVPNPKKKGERMNVNKSLFYLHVTPDFARQQLLPALALAAQSDSPLPALPAGASANQRVRMGAGETRRVGLTADEWIKDSTARTKFLQYAADKFNFDEDEVVIALENASGQEFDKLTDYRGLKAAAIGALIAAYTEYDASEAEAMTVQMRLDPETWEAAKLACDRMNADAETGEPEASFDTGTGGSVEE